MGRVLILLAVCWFLLQCVCSGLPVSQGLGWSNRQDWAESQESVESELCTICMEAVTLIQIVVDSNASFNDIYPYAKLFCEYAVDKAWHYIGSVMCPGLVRSYGPVILYVATHRVLDPIVVCKVLHFCPNTSDINEDKENGALFRMLRNIHKTVGENFEKKNRIPNNLWMSPDSDIPAKTDTLEQRKQHHKTDTQSRTSQSTNLTILQLADIHLDRDYKKGSPSKCDLYLCCHGWFNGTAPAGHYGEYSCDLPIATLNLLMDTIKELDPQPDFIIYTGDNPPHNVWNETWTSQLADTKFVVDYLADHLPHLTIYPAMGNHETWPESEYLATLPAYQYLTKELAEYWQMSAEFPPEALQTIAEGGYYSMEIKKGLRLMAFNSDYGYSPNFFTFLNEDNPYYYKQMEWMIEQLTQAKENGEKVIITAHIPPGDLSNLVWYGEFYLDLTKRFSDTIVGHFFGHTHQDQFQLVQDKDGVYGVVLVAPSVTPYGHINPSFRLYTMDKGSFQLLEYHQYHLNLTKANELAEQGVTPQFELAYTSSLDYDLKNLSPNAWADLVQRFRVNDTLLDEYHYNIHARSNITDKTCDALCKVETICAVSNVNIEEYFKCVAKQ